MDSVLSQIKIKNSIKPNSVIGFKIFSPGLTCRQFKYKRNEWNECDPKRITLCQYGFHFCRDYRHPSFYYPLESENIYAVVLCDGVIHDGDYKSVCSRILILETFSLAQWKTLTTERIDYRGSTCYYVAGLLHREGGLPAVERSNGTKEWHYYGQLHRSDQEEEEETRTNTNPITGWTLDILQGSTLPSMEGVDGRKEWYRFGQLHRLGDLPAIVSRELLAWYVNGRLHRGGDLPAMLYKEGKREWYKNGLKHRGGGPALDNGKDYSWYQDGKLHRSIKDGPTSVRSGILYWYEQDQLLALAHKIDGQSIPQSGK